MSKHLTLDNFNAALPPLKHLIDKKAEGVDWNENDPAASGYVKNRPFYTETKMTPLIDNVDITLDDDGWAMNVKGTIYPVEQGKIYNIEWDGVVYECVGGTNQLVLGNLTLIGQSAGSEFPFFIGDNQDGTVAIASMEIGTHTISVSGSVTEVHKIDSKFLPELELTFPDTIVAGVGDQAEVFNGNPPECASGYNSHAEGSHSTNTGAKGGCSHAEGTGTIASGDDSHAEGYNTIAKGTASHSEGTTSEAHGHSSHASGFNTRAYGDYSHAEGYGSATGTNGVSGTGVYAHAEGQLSNAVGKGSHAEGYLSLANGEYSHAEGNSSKAYGGYSHTEGMNTVTGDSEDATLGSFAHAEGYSSKATGTAAHAEGASNAVGEYSHAESNSSAYGVSSHSESQSIAYGIRSHSEGSGKSVGTDSHAESDSLAYGVGSHAENNTVAYGQWSHAEGYSYDEIIYLTGEANATTYTVTSGNISGLGANMVVVKHNIGGVSPTITLIRSVDYSGSTIQMVSTLSKTEALSGSAVTVYYGGSIGNYSHSEGLRSLALGDYSHAEGNATYTLKSCSHSEGSYTTALSKNQHVQGRCNIPDASNVYAHIVGNGTATANSNAHTLDWDGLGWFAGGLKVGGTGQDDEAAVEVALKTDLVAMTVDEIDAICGATIYDAEEVEL